MAAHTRLLLTFALLVTVSAFHQEGWTTTPADGTETIEVTFALPLENRAWLQSFVLDVSNPKSSNYGKYLTWETLAKKVYGRPSSLKAVKDQLEQLSVSDVKTNIDGGFVIAKMPVTTASVLFNSTFYKFRSLNYGVEVVKSPEAQIPSTLAPHVAFISGHKLLPHEKDLAATLKVNLRNKSPKLDASPSSINTAYNLSLYTATNAKTSQAIASFLKQYFNEKDLATFQTQYKLPVKPITKIVGVNVDHLPGLEANLDVQYIGATGRGVSTWFVSTSGTDNHGQERFLTWIVGQSNTTDSPYVHSVSYGDVESSITADYLDRVDAEFQKFGATGRTILVASGDDGVGCAKGKQQPDWPTSSAWITSVGGTDGPTQAWSDGGGGFSNAFARPAYQNAAVTAYLKSGGAPDTKYFNSSGRAYPDVSAFATDFPIIYDGSSEAVSGTSCATPTFAGVVAALNDVLLNQGKATLGFLNPLLYQLGASSQNAFNDIASGSNPSATCPGFKAVKGWDAASGWGSPNFGIMKTLV